MRQDIYINDQLNFDNVVQAVKPAAGCLANGGLVAFPTETVYGLGANALDPQAVLKIFEAKGRPADNPLIIHVSSPGQIEPLVGEVPAAAHDLIKAFWPGPLTLILPKSKLVPDEVTAGGPTVAIRMPNHPVALALISVSGKPIAAPSANLSGRPSPTTAEHVRQDLDNNLDYLIDAGSTSIGLESTVLDLTTEIPTVLRLGAISAEQIKSIIGQAETLKHTDLAQPVSSPGLKYRHYAPKAKVLIVPLITDEMVSKYQAQGLKVATIALKTESPNSSADFSSVFATPEGMAQNLYATLRQADELNVDIIVAEAVSLPGVSQAVMDRLKRASED